MISFPTLANVVHLQLLIAFATQRLCTLHLHTSQLNPCEVTPDEQKKTRIKLMQTDSHPHINVSDVKRALKARHFIKIDCRSFSDTDVYFLKDASPRFFATYSLSRLLLF